ncbi:hypothetical protein Tco_0309044 [Tanacetum coccineum]
METIKAQQIALDDALVAPANRLKIGKCNHRLSSTLKSNEPTIQVVLDALKLTPFYKAFQITANVPEIYMQEFALDSQRSFAAIINRCLSGKTIGLDSLRLSRAQIIWGMYHKNVDYVYLLWEDLVYQVENKNSKKNNDMCYPRFTKVIIDYFMSKDQSISRRNKLFWHTARDDPMFNTIRVISRHQDTQIYGVILPNELTNQEMLDSKACKEYYVVASGAEPPKAKTKYKKKADEPVTPSKSKTAHVSKGSRLKSPAKVAKTDKKKQPAMMPKTKGLAVQSKVALTKAEQMKIATKRSKTQFYSSHASGSGDGADTQSEVPDEQQQKTFSQDEEDVDEETDVNDDSEGTKSDNDGDDLTHPNLSTYKVDDEEEEEEKADDEEMSSDQREQDEEDDLYRDVNINLERSDAEMTNAQANKDTEDAHVTLTVVPPVVQQQSSSVSSDLVSKFINPSSDTDERRSGCGCLATNKFREEAQAENQEFLNQVDSTMKAIIKEQVQAQISKIMPKIEKYVTESLGAEVLDLYNALVESFNSDKDIIFSYGDVITLNHVCTTLNDIAIGLQMDYLPKRKRSKQDKQRARVMINAIDKKLRDRRLMRNLEKFVGGRPYGGDLRLLERTI